MSLTSFLAPAIPRAHALAFPTRRITPSRTRARRPAPAPAAAAVARSYTSTAQGLSRTLAEFWNLFQGMRAAARQIPKDVAYQVALQRLVEGKFRRLTGRRLEGCDILEIGAGQSLRAATGFAARNDVTATDLDVYAAGLDLPAYFRLLRSNGPKRLLKTVGLRILGTDRPYNRALREALGVPRLPRPRFRQMDATRLATPDASVDLVYSFSVFEHLPDPRAAFREAKRILRPGGCLFTHLHLYTCDSGCHDLRIIRGDHSRIAYWPHLRPDHTGEVQNAAYLNRLSLKNWLDLFAEEFGDYDLQLERDDDLKPRLDALRAAGELAGYSDEELLVHNIIATWRKPL